MPHLVSSLALTGPAGKLEALISRPEPARGSAVVCHPHPLFGGTMHNKVVYHTAKALVEAGYATLRFNFRGVGQSGGRHDNGLGEQDDLRAALGWLREQTADAQPLIAGFSFGSRVALQVGCLDAAPRALIALGFVTRQWDFSFLAGCPRPKLFIQGERDEYGPPDEIRPVIEAAPSARLVVIPGADHFFAEHLEQVRAEVGAFVAGLA